jgi:two-component system CheB/CheR fusion protein
LAFVVVQHLDPSHASLMPDLLARHTRMKVVQAENRFRVQQNCVYTIPPNKFLSIEHGILHLSEPIRREGLRMPIDFFFRSLAKDQDAHAIAVLLSGGGSDGTLGIREIRAAGGLVIVQAPETAQFESMIQSALATGQVDYILPTAEIPIKLLEYVRGISPEDEGAPSDGDNDSIAAILALLTSEGKNDFRSYKKSTIRRRILRRMAILRTSKVNDYYRLLAENPEEVAKLAKDMLIGVTSFFRDPDAYDELREKVVVRLVSDKDQSEAVRAWVPGCATGEEVYSIVILLIEEMERQRKKIPLQIFASDIDSEALRHARDGVYPESISVDVSEERLARFFVRKDGVYYIDRRVRDAVTFAEHNLMTDPPFLRMDLISCRNLLIYLEPEMQKKILNIFGFALSPGKYLFLGKSDGLLERTDVFEPISRNWRIFRRQQSVSLAFDNFSLRARLERHRLEEHPPIRLGDLNQQVLLSHFNATLVLINENGQILHFYGTTQKYLQHPTGDANLSLYDMVDSRNSLVLRLAVERAAREHETAKLQTVGLNREDEKEVVEVTIRPVLEPRSGRKTLAVIFEPRSHVHQAPATAVQQRVDAAEESMLAQLESDNQRLKQDLQAAVENFQQTQEEFTAANEEILAINEELQSANEELETSKEELQSVNEELVTVNSQLNEKVDELTKANDDLANFLNSAEVATIFLDRAYCVRRFTPSATKFLHLIALDVGRPLAHISNKLVEVDLSTIAETVMSSLVPVSKEVQTSDGVWYMLRCLPYRTLTNVIDGVVFTFSDVTTLKRSEAALAEAREDAENIIDSMRESLLVLNSDFKVILANRAFFKTFHVSPEETEQKLVYELGNGQWNIPELRQLLTDVLGRNTSFENFEVKHNFPRIGYKVLLLNARTVSGSESEKPRMILLAIEDVTEFRQREEERKWLEAEVRQAQKMESVGTLAAGIAHDFNNILNIIQGYTAELEEYARDNPDIAASLEAINEAIKRGSTTVRHLLTVARKTEPKVDSINVPSLLRELMQFMRQTFPKNIDLNLELSDENLCVTADRNQVNQALLNLCVNARDAMPQGGKLILRGKAIEGDSIKDRGEMKAELYCCIEVTDTGTGMSEAVRTRIFEPFYTTKAMGHGTGLGLAVVYGVITHHGGMITVESQPGRGTTFRIYLPIASQKDAS